MNSRTLSTMLSEFEESNAEIISKLTFRGKCIWPYVKISLYFGLIRNEEPIKDHKPSLSPGLIKKVVGKAQLLARFTLLLWKMKLSKSDVFVNALSIDKVKMDDRVYANQIIDGIFINNKNVSCCYSESSYNGDYREPAMFPATIRLDDYTPMIAIYLKLLKKDVEAEAIATVLYDSLKKFFSGSPLIDRISAQSIRNLILEYGAEYNFYKKLFKAIKPKLIITSERTGYSIFGASHDLGIKSVDLQHGVIDSSHPQYVFSSKLQHLKPVMSLPSHVAVFGDMHKKVMTDSDFWSNEEVFVLGNYRVDNIRDKLREKNGSLSTQPASILIPTQWNIFPFFKQLIENISEIIEGRKYKVVLKLHPLETRENLEQYELIKANASSQFEFADKTANTYDLISNAFLVVGFDSAVLLEAVALKKPVVTVSVEPLPRGILGYYNDIKLADAIKCISVNNKRDMSQLLTDMSESPGFYANWLEKCGAVSDYLYAEDYKQNCRVLVADSLEKRPTFSTFKHTFHD